KVPPALMRQYIGRYELDPKFAHDFVIYVSVKDDSLWVKPSYLRQRPVIAESNHGFRDSEIPDLHLTFVKDERKRHWSHSQQWAGRRAGEKDAASRTQSHRQ